MRISGPISVQRARPAPGWTSYGARIVYVRTTDAPVRHAPALPPQRRGDAACLTLFAAQMLAGDLARIGSYAAAIEDDAPLFALSA
jgi:hypothetical protein